MKHIKVILLLVFLTTVGPIKAAILSLGPSVALNLTNTNQVDVRNNVYTPTALVAAGAWDRSIYNLRISALGGQSNQTPVVLQSVNSLTFTISKTPGGPAPFVFNFGTLNLKFNVEGIGAPVINAYSNGVNVTGSAGLVGLNVVGTDLSGKGIDEIVISDFRLQDTPSPSLGGAFNIGLVGDQQMVTFNVTATAEATVLTAGTFATTTVVPEVSPSAMFASICLFGLMFRKR